MSASAIGATRARRRLPAHVRIPWTGITTAAIMIVLAIVNFAIQPSLASLFQVGILMQTALPLVIVAAAQTLVVLVRGIDLSVGGMMVLANTAAVAWVGGRSGTHQLLLFGILGLAAAAGLLNGLLVAVGRYEPFVATLGTWTIFNGIALTILPSDGGTPPPSLVSFAFGSTAGVPNSLIAIVVLLALWRLLRGSRFGTRLYAVGADEERARLNGVSVARVKLCVYALAGLLAGLAGVMLAGVTSSGTPTAGNAYILTSVAAVVIGGTSLAGGSGGVGLTVMAAVALTFISNIISAINLETWVSVAASSGLLLIVVVARSLIDAELKRRRA